MPMVVSVACVGKATSRVSNKSADAAHTSKRTIFVPGGELMDIVDTAIKLDKLITLAAIFWPIEEYWQVQRP